MAKIKLSAEFWRAVVSALVALLTSLGVASCVFDNTLSNPQNVPVYAE